MKPKNLLIAVSLLAVLSVAAWFFNRPTPAPSARDPRLGKPILDTPAAEKAATVRITENGKTVLLTRDSDAGWHVSSYHDLPAEFSKLATLVNSLNSTHVERLVTSSPDRIARLEFSDTTLTFSDSAGKTLLALTLGKHAESGGGRYLRFNGEDKAYLARLNASLDAEPRNWADATLVRFAPADIAKVTFDAPVSVTVSRADAKTAFAADITPEGRRLKTDSVTSLLSTLSSLRFTDTKAVDGPQAVGARAAARTVTLTTFDGKTLAFAIGRQPERVVAKPDAIKADPLSFINGDAAPAPADLISGTTEKQPAGPVFAFVTHSNASAPVNSMMNKRAFQVGEHVLTAVPATADALFENIPPPPAVETTKAPEPAEANNTAP